MMKKINLERRDFPFTIMVIWVRKKHMTLMTNYWNI